MNNLISYIITTFSAVITFISPISKNNLNITPTLAPTPTIAITELQGTPKVLGKTTTNTTISPDELVVVTSVTDGDTIKVKINGKIEPVRLIGIDTPEVVDPRKPVQCFGKEASSKAKELLSGHKVKLEADPTQGDRDKYKRLLRYVWREDGLFFNDWMIRNGYAHEYTYDFPYQYQSQFKEAEKYARENNLGLWNPNVCISLVPTTTKPTPTFYPSPKVNYTPPFLPTQSIQPTPLSIPNIVNLFAIVVKHAKRCLPVKKHISSLISVGA